jgi:hypothetical protein
MPLVRAREEVTPDPQKAHRAMHQTMYFLNELIA